MCTALDDPEQILRPERVWALKDEDKWALKDEDKWTRDDEDKWQYQTNRSIDIGFGGGFIATWLATPTLRRQLRLGLSMGAGCLSGGWLALRSEESRIDHILSMKGSQEQRKLANRLVNGRTNGWGQYCLSKHFFPEEVYVDSSVDRAIRRWRYRNSFVDPLARFQSISYGEENDSKENNIKKTTMVPKRVSVSAGDNGMGYPSDSILGLAESAEDVPQLETPKALSRRERHREKRSRRRHRHHRDDKETDI